MSIKGKVLHSVVSSPMTADRYLVYIPNIIDSPITCHATSLPFDERNEVVVSVRGQEVFLPAKTHVQGTWSCSLYESVEALSTIQVELAKLLQVNDVNTTPAYCKPVDVFIFLVNNHDIPVFGRVLRNAWIKSVTPISFSSESAGKNVSCEVVFRYQTCDRVL